MTARLVVLASGSGSNCQAILDACAEGRLDATVAAVVTNRERALVRDRARVARVPDAYVSLRGLDAEEIASALIEVIDPFEPDLVVLAGWMRILNNTFCGHYPVVNLHPALPGEFPGLHAIERAFDEWQQGSRTASGVMVHWVPDAGVDDGPVIDTTSVPFEPGDTLERFAQRVHEVEHRLIVRAVGKALIELGAKIS